MELKTYAANVDGHHEFIWDTAAIEGADVQQVRPGVYHLLYRGSSFEIVVGKVDLGKKTYELFIDGTRHEVRLSDPYDVLVDQLGLARKVRHAIKAIHAPMPGLVRQIMVTAGQEVTTGTPILILEAMKMENVIKAPDAGVVKAVEVAVGDAVDKGAILVTFE